MTVRNIKTMEIWCRTLNEKLTFKKYWISQGNLKVGKSWNDNAIIDIFKGDTIS